MFDDRPWGANPGGAEPTPEPGPDVAAGQPQQVRKPLVLDVGALSVTEETTPS